jgi:hypothetical protein
MLNNEYLKKETKKIKKNTKWVLRKTVSSNGNSMLINSSLKLESPYLLKSRKGKTYTSCHVDMRVNS